MSRIKIRIGGPEVLATLIYCIALPNGMGSIVSHGKEISGNLGRAFFEGTR